MSWARPDRPDWVAAINRGEVPLIAEEAARPLSRDSLLGEARARMGLPSGSGLDGRSVFGAPGFEAEAFIDRLDRVLDALESEAALNVMGRWMTRRFLSRLLEVRLQILAYLRSDPAVVDEQITAPLFVAGAPRTGTTILHAMLASNTHHRVPEGWELLRPVPPPSPDPIQFAADPRIALADRELVLPQTVVSGLHAIHVYGGRRPKECLSSMSFAMQSEEFTARYRTPSYSSWLEEADMRPAYDMHRLVLQILQRRTSSTAWVLKSPVHLHSLPTLLDVFPDARIAITHRDPSALIASLSSLIANLRWAHSDEVDIEEIAQAHADRYARTFDSLENWSDSGTIPPERVHHSQFADFLSAPIETLRDLYARFEMDWTPQVEEAARATLEARPRDQHGAHAYSLDDMGLDGGTLRARFTAYRARFGIPDESQS